eukprot:754702-Amphidinium_carterae.1
MHLPSSLKLSQCDTDTMKCFDLRCGLQPQSLSTCSDDSSLHSVWTGQLPKDLRTLRTHAGGGGGGGGWSDEDNKQTGNMQGHGCGAKRCTG